MKFERTRQRSHEPKEFEEKIVQVNRVSKKTKGGNKIGFSVLVVVGDRKGKVGVGLGNAPYRRQYHTRKNISSRYQ